jgi:hypothetical protein
MPLFFVKHHMAARGSRQEWRVFARETRGGKVTGSKFLDELKQRADKRAASAFGLVFYIHEGADGVHFFIEGLKGRIFVEELKEARVVKRSEVVGAFSQGGQQSPVILDLRCDLAGEFHEVPDKRRIVQICRGTRRR